MTKPRILIAVADSDVARQVSREIKKFAAVLPPSQLGSEEAVGKAEELSPDLVLIDIDLPGSPVAAAETIRKSFSIPSIFMTDRIDHPALRNAAEPPYCVLKPVTAHALEPLVNYALKRSEFERREFDGPGGAREAAVGDHRCGEGELVRIQRALEEGERRYRQMVELAPWGIVVHVNGIIKYINPAGLRIAGYSDMGELAGTPILERIHPDDRARVVERLRTQLEYQIPLDPIEERLLRRDGEPVLCEVTSLVFALEGSRAVMAFFNDITSRVRAIDALHESERVFSTLISNLPGFVYRCANDKNWTMEFISDGCLEITGYSAIDFIGNVRLAFNDIIHPDYREPLWNKWQEVLRNRTTFEDEYPIITAGGETRWVWERGRGIFSDGGDLLFLEGFITDITARKRASEELRESEARYRLLYENAAEGIITFDSNTMITDVNRRASEIFGYERSEVIGRTVIDIGILHPDDIPHAAENIARMFKDVDVLASRYKFIRKDGSVRVCHMTGAAMRDSAGILLSVTTIVSDVTEQVRVEEALRASDERYRALFQGAAEGILVADIETMKFNRANPAVCAFLGYAEEELLGMGVPDIHPPEHLDHVIHEFRVPLETGTSLAADIPCLRKDGAVVYADIYNSIMMLDGRQCTVGFFIDITQRKKAERELARSEEKFRSVVEKSHMGIAIVNDRYEYIYVNDEFCRLAGYTAGDIIGKNFTFLLNEESKALAVDRYVRRQRGEQVPDHYEFSFVRQDGSLRSGEVRSAVYQDSAGRVNSLIQVLDITEQKMAEQERRDFEMKIQQAQKLESLGVLAGGIAHDFNNLLMAILGNIDLALMDLSPAAPVRDNLNEAAKASQRAADLCRQMLAYSGKGRFVVETVGINDLIEEMGRMLEVSISKKVVLRYNLARDLPAIQADTTQLRQVIMNMVINASDATGEQSGVISITTGCMQCDRHYLDGTWLAENLPEGYYVFIEVADTGCGMDQETMKKIFDPFFTTKFTGRGLGLAAVLGIVRGHHGAIRVYSEPGRGTTFKVLLPASGEPGDAAIADAGCADGWTASGTVLLVDDEETVRALGARMLERCGFTVLTASDGREAMDIYRVRAAEIVCIILDLTMPHMDGEETFRNLRRLNSDVRVIMSSGYNEQEVTQRFAGKGLVGFIQKPYRFEELVKKLRAILE